METWFCQTVRKIITYDDDYEEEDDNDDDHEDENGDIDDESLICPPRNH